MVRPLVWAMWSRFASVAARAYVVGPELSDAVRACRRLTAVGEGATICYWNLPEDGVRQVVGAYLDAAEALPMLSLDTYLSIKAPAFGFDDTLLAPVTEAARRHRLGMHFDSLAPEAADRTRELIQRLLVQGVELGCTLPGRWRRSLEDADWAVRHGLNARVVKGQWPDPERAEASPEELRQQYLSIIDRLAGRARMVRVATHDAPLAQEAFRLLLRAGTPCEHELLFGLPMGPSRRVARAAGVPVRQYLPYGHGWLPYCLSQLAAHPRLGWWLLRDLCALPFKAN